MKVNSAEGHQSCVSLCPVAYCRFHWPADCELLEIVVLPKYDPFLACDMRVPSVWELQLEAGAAAAAAAGGDGDSEAGEGNEFHTGAEVLLWPLGEHL